MARTPTDPSIVRGMRFQQRDWARMQKALKRMNAAGNLDMTEADFVRYAVREISDRVLDDKLAETAA